MKVLINKYLFFFDDCLRVSKCFDHKTIISFFFASHFQININEYVNNVDITSAFLDNKWFFVFVFRFTIQFKIKIENRDRFEKRIAVDATMFRIECHNAIFVIYLWIVFF